MGDFCPTAFVIKYDQVLNFCFYKYFKEIEPSFKKDETGLYICSENISKQRLQKFFKKEIITYLKNIRSKLLSDDKFKIKKFFVIDGCSDIHQHFLFDDSIELFKTRFECIESDIRFDFNSLEEIWDQLFLKFFKEKEVDGWYFLKSNDITSEELINIFKLIFGKQHCQIIQTDDKQILIDNTEKTFKRKKDLQLSKLKIEEISMFIKEQFI